MKLGAHTVRAGDLVRSRSRRGATDWKYGQIVKLEHGLATVRFQGGEVREWIMSEMPWRHEHGMLEIRPEDR